MEQFILWISIWILFILGMCLIFYWVFYSKINSFIRRLIELNEEQSNIILIKITKVLFSVPQIFALLWILFIALFVCTGIIKFELTNLIWITVALTIWPAVELLFNLYIAIIRPTTDENVIKDKKDKIKFYAYYASFLVLVWVASRFRMPESISPADGILTLIALIIFTNEQKDIMVNRESINRIDYRIKILLLVILILFGAVAFYLNFFH